MKVKTFVNKARKHAIISKYHVYHWIDGAVDYIQDVYDDYRPVIAEFGDEKVGNYVYTGRANETVELDIYTDLVEVK